MRYCRYDYPMAFRHSKAKQSSILDYQDSKFTDIKIIESVEAVTSHI